MEKEGVESQLVGRTSPIGVNMMISDIVEDVVSPEFVDDTIAEPVAEEIIEETPPETTVPVVEPAETIEEPVADAYGEHTHAALFAEEFKLDGAWPSDLEVEKDLTGVELKNIIQDHWRQEMQVELEAEYESRFDSEMIQFLDYIRNGGSHEVLVDALSHRNFFSLNVKGDSPEALQNRKEIISSRYTEMGLSPKHIKDMLNRLFFTDDETDLDLRDADRETRESLEYFQTLETEKIQQAQQVQALQTKDREKTLEDNKRKIQQLITSGKIGGQTFERKDQRLLEDFLFKPSQLIPFIDENGRTKKQRVTGYGKAMYELNQNMEKQLIFAELLRNGFNLTKIKSEAREEMSSGIIDKLNGKVTTQVVVTEATDEPEVLPPLESMEQGTFIPRRRY